MQRHITPIPCKPWTLNGLSDRLLVSHYENNYGTAVRSLNSIWDRLAEVDLARTSGYEIRALKREELMAMGSVTLHELYFGSLGGDGAVLFTGSGTGTKLADTMSAAPEQQFGSVAAWQREYVVLAEALSGGSGWVVLAYARQDGKLYNQLAFDDSQAITDAVPLLVLDMYEHAYQTEFGANASAYIHAFMRNVDCTVVADRLRRAGDRGPLVPDSSSRDGIPSMSPEELAAQRAGGAPLQIIDARPRYHFSRSSDMMDRAVYRDPERVYEWASELSTQTPVVVY
jgi:superoxide dismutase, Fe-Mn family